MGTKKTKESKQPESAKPFTKADFDRLVDKALRTPASPKKDKRGKE